MKKILIIGGGISGAATLHYLSQKYTPQEASVILLEKENTIGGTVGSIPKDNNIFEAGPNGFLGNSSQTFELVKELGLDNELLCANEDAKYRHIYTDRKHHMLPTSLSSFLGFELLPVREKIRLISCIFKRLEFDERMTVGEFAEKNIGEHFKKFLMDPMVSGIYGGGVDELNLCAAFPRFAQILKSGKSLFQYRFTNRKKPKANKGLYTFKGGMQAPLNQIAAKYKDQINYNQTIEQVTYKDQKYRVKTHDQEYEADQVVLSVPAYVAAKMLDSFNPKLAGALGAIDYAPIAVVGLAFKQEDVIDLPVGFGLLIPSVEDNQVLGVLFESQIYPNRYNPHEVVFRVMIGGTHHRAIVEHSEKEIVARALKELAMQFSIKNLPQTTFFKLWNKAIPQYTNNYLDRIKTINEELKMQPGLHIVANYYKGVSFNDCIKNAFQTAANIEI